MSKIAAITLYAGLLVRAGICCAVPSAAADMVAPAQPITITTRIELEKKSTVDGVAAVQLVPADRIAPGDLLVYTLLVRNEGAEPVAHASFTSPIPEHLIYVANSALGPGAEVSFSVDGGRSFASPAELTVPGADGKPRPAGPADYTTIRWILHNRLQPGSVARARFRAIVK